jgi:hypothetical protein
MNDKNTRINIVIPLTIRNNHGENCSCNKKLKEFKNGPAKNLLLKIKNHLQKPVEVLVKAKPIHTGHKNPLNLG